MNKFAKDGLLSSSLSYLFAIHKEKVSRKNPWHLFWRGRRDSTGQALSCLLRKPSNFLSLLLRKRWTIEFESLLFNFILPKRRSTKIIPCASSGAEGETRTLAPVSRPTPLAGAPRHQLEYFCMVTYIIKFCCCRWQREWDSNPRYVAVRRFSRPFRYNHFGISP